MEGTRGEYKHHDGVLGSLQNANIPKSRRFMYQIKKQRITSTLAVLVQSLGPAPETNTCTAAT